MTFLREEKKCDVVDGGRRSAFKVNYKVQFFSCNQCGAEFSRRSSKKKYIGLPYHFCKRECSIDATKKGGAIDRAKRQYCLEKYGVEHHLSSDQIQQKRVTTCIERFGGISPMHSQKTKDKTAKTIIDRYGTHFSNTDEVKEKKKATCLEKYGVDSYTKTDEFKAKIDWSELNRKGYRTRKENGISPISKIEKKFGDFLRQHFGEIEDQTEVNGWLIDFYIPILDVYVQFDGDYWHGLDVTIEQLLEQADRKPQFSTIAGTKLRDQKKVEWFSQNGKKLIRIRESLFKKKKYDEILSLFKESSYGL